MVELIEMRAPIITLRLSVRKEYLHRQSKDIQYVSKSKKGNAKNTNTLPGEGTKKEYLYHTLKLNGE